jgi:Ser/Thr protein kinase RdoA (MazF antagonist)
MTPVSMEPAERISVDDLRHVLTHYALGELTSVKAYPRGSRKSPKLLLRGSGGDFLLKRRAVGRDEPQRVAFTHALMDHMRRRGFPVPRVARTRSGDTLVQHENRVYELFEFVSAERFSGSLPETSSAGDTLALFHKRAAEFRSDWQPESKSYHDRAEVRQALTQLPGVASSHDSVAGNESELIMIAHELLERYDAAAAACNAAGIGNVALTLTHGDWHPGNMLFRSQRIAVVLDFDGVRPNPAVLELANGMLQFSMLRETGDPQEWPAHFDETRMRRLMLGYLARRPIAPEHRRMIPSLMVQALIAETSVPIAVTGSFGHMPGLGVLRMAQRKVHWIVDNQARLERWMIE